MRMQNTPNPWVPRDLYAHAQSVVAGVPASVGPGDANAAIYCPVIVPVNITLTSLSFVATNSTGNFDLGLYTKEYALLASLGTTAMGSTVHTLSLSELRFEAGSVVYAALVLSSTSGRYLGVSINAVRAIIGAGCGEEASALPLPATATAVTVSSWQQLPIFAFGTR